MGWVSLDQSSVEAFRKFPCGQSGQLRTEITNQVRFDCIGCPLPVSDLILGSDIQPETFVASSEFIHASFSLVNLGLPISHLAIASGDGWHVGLEVAIELEDRSRVELHLFKVGEVVWIWRSHCDSRNAFYLPRITVRGYLLKMVGLKGLREFLVAVPSRLKTFVITE
jgi:hypothetical protein